MSGLNNTRDMVLADIRNILLKEGNGRVCIGYETLAVTNGAVVKLTVPATAFSAEITLESAGSSNTAVAVRYTLTGTDPTTGAVSATGVPIGDYDTIEILGNTNLSAFKAIGADAANTKYLKIHYFS